MITRKIYASTVAKLDSNVYTGGGTDDTAALQDVLDMAKDGDGVHLIMDGAALISKLMVYSNTTIECMNRDCGFFQKAQTNCALVSNYNRDFYRRNSRNIVLKGGTYNQNCLQQAHHTALRSCDEEVQRLFSMGGDGGQTEMDVERWVFGLEFYGVEYLEIRDLTVRNFRTFAVTIGGFRNVTIENVWLDMQHHMNGNQDGFHFWGPGQYLTVKNCGGCVSDDIMNIGPDEMDKKSSITDVLVDGLFLDDAEQAVRLLSRGDGRLDRVTIRNVTGQYRSYGFYIDPWFPNDTLGNFGNIFIENVDLKEHPRTYPYHEPVLFSIGGNIECLTMKNIRHHNGIDKRVLMEIGIPYGGQSEMTEDSPGHQQKMQNIIIDGLTITENEKDIPGRSYITIHDRVENMVLKNVMVIKNQPEENGTLVEFRDLGEIGSLAEESIYVKGLKTVYSHPEKIESRMRDISR